MKSSPLTWNKPWTFTVDGTSGTFAILSVQSVPFLLIAFSNLPSLYWRAIAQPSIFGSIINLVSGSNPSINSSIWSLGSEGSGRAFLLVK